MEQKPAWFEQVLALSIGHEQLAGVVKVLEANVNQLLRADENRDDRKEMFRAMVTASSVSGVVGAVLGYVIAHLH